MPTIIVTAAGVPGLEPRMAVPETAVLPITPYPIGRLSPLVTGYFPARRPVRVTTGLSMPGRRADYQRFRVGFSRAGCCGRRAVPTGAQARHAAVATEQLQRLEQRRADRRSRRGHPDRSERLARFELQSVEQRALERRLDRGGVPFVDAVERAAAPRRAPGPASARSSLAAAFSSSTNSSSLRNFNRSHASASTTMRVCTSRAASANPSSSRPVS